MKQTRESAFFIGLGLLVGCGLTFIALRFLTPDMTGVRAIITYWYILVPGAVGGGLVVWSMEGWR